ncbi:unnamed protein product, partial [Allacma fusca]
SLKSSTNPGVRVAIKTFRKSAKLRSKFKHACKIELLSTKMLLLDVATRWNSTYTMLKRVHEMRKPFNVAAWQSPNVELHFA